MSGVQVLAKAAARCVSGCGLCRRRASAGLHPQGGGTRTARVKLGLRVALTQSAWGLAWLLAAGCGGRKEATVGPQALTLFVPCGMELPFMAARDAFAASRPGTAAEVVLDNANVLVRRILEKGERADLLVSPGLVEMDRMVAAGAVRREDIVPFARFELVLFTPRSNPAAVGTLADLTRDSVKTIAIADPVENSVGRCTKQALEALGLWTVLAPKMMLTDHPITAYKHVAREKAEASFAYRSCPLRTAPDKLEYSKVRIVETVPPGSYDPAFAYIAPLATSPRAEAARSFIGYLLSEAGQAMLLEYDLPGVTGGEPVPR